MITVGSTEFRKHIYRYLGAVEEGNVVVVTRRGREVARFRPYDPEMDPPLEQANVTAVAVAEGLGAAP